MWTCSPSPFFVVEQLALQTADTLAALRRYRNSLLPISNLPPELLSRIFELAVAPVDGDSRRVDHTPCLPADTAVNIARVSSSWRDIAIASSQMWCYIIDNDIQWPSRPRIFLHRSRNSYLHVYTALPDSLGDNSVWPTIVGHHSDRVRELHLLVNRVFLISDLLDAISVALPSLDYLTMAGSEITDLILPFLHPPMIFGGDTSNLKAMTLGPDAPFIPGNSFPSLVNLKLRGMGRGVHATTSTLMDLLSNSPRLETFEVRFPLHDLAHNDQQSNNRPPLPLNYLKALWMSHTSVTSAFGLLAHLELPAITTVRLTNLATNRSRAPIPRNLVLPLAHMGLTQLDILEGGKHSGPETPFELHFIAHGPGPDGPTATTATTATTKTARTGLWVHVSFVRTRDRALAEQYTHEQSVFWDVLRALPTRAVTALRMSALRAAHLKRVALIVGDDRAESAMPLESVVVRSVKAGSATEQREAVAYLARVLLPYDYELEADADGWGGSASTSRREADAPVAVAVAAAAPRLRELTIELNRAWKPGMGDLLVTALRERKARGYPLRSVACSALSVRDTELEGRMREHVVGDVKVTTRKLWEIRKVPEVWMVKNDYWRLYPESLARTVNGWGLPENT